MINIPETEYTTIYYNNSKKLAADFINKKVDCIFVCTTHPNKFIISLSKLNPIRVLEVFDIKQKQLEGKDISIIEEFDRFI